MTKKPATIFDFINGMTHEKKEWSKYTDIDKKKFSPFIVNRWLSMKMELIEVINQLQKYTIGLLSPRDAYYQPREPLLSTLKEKRKISIILI